MKIPCRLAVEVLSAVKQVHSDAENIPSHMRLLIVHARQDSIVEPAVSIHTRYVICNMFPYVYMYTYLYVSI